MSSKYFYLLLALSALHGKYLKSLRFCLWVSKEERTPVCPFLGYF